MIPNACSFIGKGFNPVCFNDRFYSKVKEQISSVFSQHGKSPEVAENKLEAYAIITGMEPTYLWFQFEILYMIAKDFGLSDPEAREAIVRMVSGAVNTLLESHLNFSDVKDLIPVRPLKDSENDINNILNTKLKEIYKKLVD